MIEIPCDYNHPQGGPCEEGQVLIYGEMGGRPPETITCPRCGGTGKTKVSVATIRTQIKEMDEEREELVRQIFRLRQLLLRNGYKLS